MVKNILFTLLFVVTMVGCNNDDEIEIPAPDLRKTFIPDDSFEQALIELGIDDIQDDSVLTKKIENLKTLNIANREVDITDLTGIEDFIFLTSLNCGANNIRELDVSKLTELKFLSCYNNNLSSLDVSQNSRLESLSCFSNKITELDVTKNIYLKDLTAQNNKISYLDVSQNPDLWRLSITDNNLSEINIANNKKLVRLFVGNNSIQHMDISQHPDINIFYCYGNKLSQLIVSNGYNHMLQTFEAQNNPSLFCIQVDDEERANSGVHNPYKNWELDEGVILSEDCGY